jgi:hypothetical protein
MWLFVAKPLPEQEFDASLPPVAIPQFHTHWLDNTITGLSLLSHLHKKYWWSLSHQYFSPKPICRLLGCQSLLF